jgi:hypothetical protein
MEAAPKTTLQRPRRSALRKAPGELLPARVQKSYFMLSSAERDLLNTALEKFRPGRHEPVLVGGLNRLKTALKLMGVYRLVIEEVQDARAMTNYTRWIEAVLVNETEDQVYVTFSPRFEHLWLEVKNVSSSTPPVIQPRRSCGAGTLCGSTIAINRFIMSNSPFHTAA